jgi:predicted nucleic acid-binding protein
LSSEPAPFRRIDPARHTATLAYRTRDQLPFDVDAVPREAILMLDTTVYIDAQKTKLPPELAARKAGQETLHSAVALGEIAASIGLLDPAHAGTPTVVEVLLETLDKADPQRTVAPSSAAWLEASILSGVLARTQQLGKDARRKLLNDALVFLSARETGAVLVSRNVKDVDLLLQLRPGAPVLLYDHIA